MISWTSHVKNEDLLHVVKGERISSIPECKLDWSHLASERIYKTRYCRKDRGKDKSEGKTSKKT